MPAPKFTHRIEMRDITTLKTDGINPNFVSDTIQDSIKQHIEKDGFYGAIIVNKDGWVVDGKHRLQALKDLGATKVPVIQGDWSDAQAQIEMIRFNRERGVMSPIDLADLLDTLNTKYEMPVETVSLETDIDRSELEMLEIVDNAVKTAVDQPYIKITWSHVEEYITSITDAVKSRQPNCDVIYYVGRGGMIPARLLADRLHVKHIKPIDAIHECHSTDKPVIIDDCYDTGATYTKWKDDNVPFCVMSVKRDISQEAPDVIYGKIQESGKWLVHPWEYKEYKEMLSGKTAEN